MLIGAVSLVGLAGALSVIANVSFGAGFVCFNAYLPLLVRNIEHIRKKSEQIQTLEGEINSFSGGEIDDITIAESESAALLPGAAGLNEQGDDVIAEGEQGAGSDLAQKKARLLTSKSQLAEEKAQIMGQISARGFASGYFGGILLLLVCLTISYLDKSSARSLKFGIFLSGLWWLAFAALAGVWLKRRPGRELRLEDSGAKRDGYTSIANVALLFAKTTLRLPQTQLILLSLIAPIFALLGTLFFPRVQQIFKMSQKQMVLLLLFLLAMVPLYGVLGLLLPFFPKLNTATELFALAMYFGFLLGAVQSFCRSMFADLIPRGRESEFFGLYAITDKGSSWLGPLAVAAITDYTHDIRYSFFFLMVLLGLPFPIIYFGVDMEKGRQEADKASKELEAAQNADTVDQDEEQDSLLSPA
ncbi:Autophagy protein 22 [Lunasporangiospora selenospora]|uniref:Autophagy-related protein n=1 Tax=Lunasporangiospora selenospora TaxID=979761 RepID=A0A9P6G303_9FUNG|nr:Autophagy protein 22 [Lunasporangiospora selenospora]